MDQINEQKSPQEPQSTLAIRQPPSFSLSHLWSAPIVNPVNLKSYTLPIFNLRSSYAWTLHLSWLDFFVAFLSWFAFPPLIPEAIRVDLQLTPNQIANSNIVALTGTLVVRIFVGPAVDRFGPRIVMAVLLLLGAIPSGLAGTVTSASGLYAVRFFIGILGGTFVPCQGNASRDLYSNIVGTANALVAGWGNAGGGATYAIMVSLYENLRRQTGMHKAWRVAFAAVPVPVLIFVAGITLLFGSDHPAGKWSQRHDAVELPPRHAATDSIANVKKDSTVVTEVDVAINESLTRESAKEILINPLTYLPALAYMTTFGFELAVDSILAEVILGGLVADLLYARFGVQAKKYFCLILGILQGFLQGSASSDLAVMMVLIVFMAVTCEMGNGANFSLVPHCNIYNNGVMTGIVGAFGNLGGICFALIFRFRSSRGTGWLISGGLTLGVNVLLLLFPSPPV
ncbi:MFS general substrate transporter [Hymenopellis radicata]|nr:MFS general substrate transporter [Hymenopellis radicata]